jgi:hypothetical protein
MTIPNVMLTNRYTEAVAYASIIHAGDVRKGTEISYLCHVHAVGRLKVPSARHLRREETLESLSGEFGHRGAPLARGLFGASFEFGWDPKGNVRGVLGLARQ